MLTLLATSVGILAALTGVFAFGLGITRTARLQNRERFLREAGAALAQSRAAPPDHARDIIFDLHRVTVSEIVARQLTSPWRAV